MNLCLITHGLPGPAYHGGAVTCWAIVKAMLARGHNVTVLSLFDTSEFNPYLESRDIQTKGLYDIGATVEFVNFDYKELSGLSKSTNYISKISRRLNSIINPQIERCFPWAKLKPEVQKKLNQIKPDAIFAYHFDVLSAIYDLDTAPIMAGVGDLWHLPGYFRWKIKESSIKKYLVDGPYQLAHTIVFKKLMLQMLARCRKRGAFAAHYAEWFREQKGFEDMLYLRTPAHDPVGDRWRELKDEYINKRESKKPKILMIGDFGTAGTWGLKLLLDDVLPKLENHFGKDGFEIHLVGGGKIDDEFNVLYNLSYIKVRGRIVPPDAEFLSSDILFVPTPITLGIRVRIITGFSYGSCVVTHKANTAGIPEIKHNENALVSENGIGLAKEIIRALENKKLRETIEQNARKTFEDYFSESAAAEKTVKEIESMK